MEVSALRVLKKWSGYKEGDIIYPKQGTTPLLIEMLIRKGIVERYEKGEEK